MFDVSIVGGGIVGLATGYALLSEQPNLKIIMIEKEAELAAHQTSHNSGVVHSGIYYRPGSLKAKLAVAGAVHLRAFCEAAGLPYVTLGKVIVAADATEVPRLQALYRRGIDNGIADIRWIAAEALRELEPHVRGVAAIHLPSVAIVDYAAVAHAFSQQIWQAGGTIQTACRVTRMTHREGAWILQTTTGELRSRALITCGGLHADRLAAMANGANGFRIVPFRGEYYRLRPERQGLVRRLVYPVPDPAVPFLGVHFTPHLDGHVSVGPNAVPALKREGYRRGDVSLGDLIEMARFPGCWRLAQRLWPYAVGETIRSWSKRAFIRQAQRLVPSLHVNDVMPDGAGVRAQAVDRAGTLLDDFDITHSPQAIHVRNVPSPAATASIEIGRFIAQRAMSAFGWQSIHEAVV